MKKGIGLLAWRMIVDNKKRSFVISLAICLTAILYTTILSIATHTIKSDQIFKQMYAGSDFHGSISEISMEEVKSITNHKLVKEAYVMSEEGYLLNENDVNNTKAELYSCDKSYILGHMFLTMLEGQYPVNEHEILLDIEYLNGMNIPAIIGSTVLLDIENNGSIEERDYILSGYYSDETYNEYVPMKAFINSPSTEGTTVYFMLTNSMNIEGKVKQIWSDVYNHGFYDVNYAYTFSKDDWFDYESILALFFTFMIVFVSGFLLIYNIYGITIARDIGIYGLLKTIGTTRVQLRKIILYHTNFLYLISIPIGLGLGYFIGGKILTPLYISLSGLHMSFEFNWVIFIFTILFTYVTTILSAMMPVQKISRVSCIEILKGTSSRTNGLRKNIRINKRERHSTTGGKPIFMAISNLCREPKKNIRMIGSISLSILLFIFVYTLTDVLTRNEKFQYADFIIRDDVEIFDQEETEVLGVTKAIGSTEVTNDKEEFADVVQEDIVPDTIQTKKNVWYRDYDYRLSEEILHKIEEIDGIEKVIPIYSTIVEADVKQLQAKIVSQGSNQQYNKYLEESTLIEGKTKVYVCSMPEEGYEYLWKGILTSEKIENIKDLPLDQFLDQFKKNGYALVGSFLLNNRDKGADQWGPISYYLPEEMISLNVFKSQYEVLVLGKNGRRLIYQLLALDYYPLITLDICLTYEDFMKEFQTYDIEAINVFVKDGFHDEVKSELSLILGSNAKLNDKREQQKEFQTYIRTIQIVCYSVSLIVFLIGILNYINTVVCGIYERRRELALLEIIGMTNTQMRRMLYYESGCYIGTSTLICALLGIPLIRWTIMQISERTVRVSMIPLTVMIGIMIIIVGITVSIAYHDMQRLTHMERLQVSE